jgi:hypothetical protein
MKHGPLRAALLLTSLALFPSAAADAPTDGPRPLPEKKVFAHYMVCCPTAGGAATLDDYKREIEEAQKRGIDGFALNCGNWKKREPHYHARTLLIYEAAKQLGTGFQLFVSLDGEALAVRSVAIHPADPRILVRACGRGAGGTLWRSGDAGHSWTRLAADRELDFDAQEIPRIEAGVDEGVDEFPLVILFARLAVRIADGSGVAWLSIHRHDALGCLSVPVGFIKIGFGSRK